MRAGDAILLELARRANVRPTVIFHAFHYRKQMGERFSAEGYSAFTGLPIAHVSSVLAVLDTLPAAMPRKARERASTTRLAADWTMPEEWVVMGRDLRFWTMDVCRTEAESFATWHRMKGSVFADWKAAWRNWITRSHREDGIKGTSEAARAMASKPWPEYCAEMVASFQRMGDSFRAKQWQVNLDEALAKANSSRPAAAR